MKSRLTSLLELIISHSTHKFLIKKHSSIFKFCSFEWQSANPVCSVIVISKSKTWIILHTLYYHSSLMKEVVTFKSGEIIMSHGKLWNWNSNCNLGTVGELFHILLILQKHVLKVNLSNKEKRKKLGYGFPQAITK